MPIYSAEVLPGDTFDLTTKAIVRMSTPLFPVMDNAFCDIMYFFVPNRLLWDHWEAMNGQNDSTYWTQPVEYQVPWTFAPSKGWDRGSVADYFGIPTYVGNGQIGSLHNIGVSSLLFRAYVKIWNDWWRDQNNMPPAYFQTGDNDVVGQRADANVSWETAITSALYGGRPLPVSKFHDYFTSALPAPQKR